MESRSITQGGRYTYRQVAYWLGVEPAKVWKHIKDRGVPISDYMLFSKEHLLRLGLYKEAPTEVYYIYESKINSL